jgi:hypothetical protein
MSRARVVIEDRRAYISQQIYSHLFFMYVFALSMWKYDINFLVKGKDFKTTNTET